MQLAIIGLVCSEARVKPENITVISGLKPISPVTVSDDEDTSLFVSRG